ncbi:uncharacterized protein [Populus alba]|uniref:uncharacterized protein n=1 Tax=Populus alba TaxID=43335 RepID=UPI003CC70874
MTSQESKLINIDRIVTCKVKIGSGDLVQVTGKSIQVVKTQHGKRYINEVLFVLGLDENLLSVGQMMEHGYYILFGGNKAVIIDDENLNNVVAEVVMGGNRCCVLGKHHREKFDKEQAWRASYPLELIHIGMCGPMQNESIGGNKYFITFIDDFSRMCLVYFLKNKSDTLNVFKKFKALVELQNGYKLKKIRSDKGGEYSSNEFQDFYANLGMEKQLIGRKGSFVGYESCEKGYRVYNLKSEKIVLSRSVIFNEDKSCSWGKKYMKSVPMPLNLEEDEVEGENSKEQPDATQPDNVGGSHLNSIIRELVENIGSDSSQHSTPSSTLVKLKTLEDIYARCHMCIIEPENYQEAAGDIAWQEAMKEELEMIEKNNTWKLVERPIDKPIIGVKWVFKTKLHLDGTV